jgi:hypothetical protein
VLADSRLVAIPHHGAIINPRSRAPRRAPALPLLIAWLSSVRPTEPHSQPDRFLLSDDLVSDPVTVHVSLQINSLVRDKTNGTKVAEVSAPVLWGIGHELFY